MNRREATVVCVFVLATFIGGAFADTMPTSPSKTTLRTSGVDIEVLNVIPALSGPAFGIFATLTASGGRTGFNGGFSFAPERGFVQVTSVIVSIISTAEATNSGDMFSAQLNGRTSSTVAVLGGKRPFARVLTLQNQDVLVGSNLLTVEVARSTPPPEGSPSSYFLYFIRLTVEYTFMA